MRTRSIEERAQAYLDLCEPLEPEYIPVHPHDVPGVMKSKVFKAEAIDGKPAFKGYFFKPLGAYHVMSYEK